MKDFIVTVSVKYINTGKTTKVTQRMRAISEADLDKRATRLAVTLSGNKETAIDINIKRVTDVNATN